MSISKFTDRFTAVIDACVLAGAFRRNLLLSLAEVGFYRPRWSKRILEETEAAILKITKGENDGSHPRRQIEEAFPESLVTGWEVFEKSLALPDPKDNHVLALLLLQVRRSSLRITLPTFHNQSSRRTKLRQFPQTSLSRI